MKNNINALLLVLVVEATIQALAEENKQLREQAAGYDRLRAVNGQLKGRVADLESRLASANEVSARNWTMYLNSTAEVDRFKRMDQYYGSIERQNETLQGRGLELARQNIALAAEAERAELAEQQLAAADARIRELEAALVLANLPADSRNTVIQMAKVAA